MGDVIEFNGPTLLDLPSEKILKGAEENVVVTEENPLVVLGWDENEMLYLASTTSDRRKILWLLEKAKLEILDPIE